MIREFNNLTKEEKVRKIAKQMKIKDQMIDMAKIMFKGEKDLDTFLNAKEFWNDYEEAITDLYCDVLSDDVIDFLVDYTSNPIFYKSQQELTGLTKYLQHISVSLLTKHNLMDL